MSMIDNMEADLQEQVINLLDSDEWLERTANDEFVRLYVGLRSMIKARMHGNDESLLIAAKCLCGHFEDIASETVYPTVGTRS